VSATDTAPAAAWAEAALTVELFAVDPAGLGGVCLRGWPGPARERICAWLRELLPAEVPLLRMPLHITEDRLLGGLSLAATLRAGRVVQERGLLAQAHGGVLLAAMAERLELSVTAQLCAALDRGAVHLEREGLTGKIACRVGLVALDEGIDEERAPAALRDRLALDVDLGKLDGRAEGVEPPDPSRVQQARARLASVDFDEDVVTALCTAALALGIDSLRAPLLCLAVARAHAALEGHARVEEEDAATAARLVLGPRATRVPAPPAAEDEPPPEGAGPDEEPDAQEEPDDGARDESPPESEPLSDAAAEQRPLENVVLEAAKSALPAGLLDALALGREARSTPRRAGQAGALRASNEGGRPAGVMAKQPRSGERVNVVETLRAAAPWQPLRQRERGEGSGPPGRRIEIRKEDFRVTRFRQRSETRVIFAVDASGSAALQRLAEAKGAVEQVLADCYVRRDHVALVAFRGTSAALLLSPTRSLVAVRRSLARLAGGGTTPLAAGIDAALALALDARRRGQTPVLVMMSDGRANIARDGRGDRPAAEADALSGARLVKAADVRALFLDTSPRPRPATRLLATEMGARYLPLPYLDAAGISRQVQSLAEGKP